MSITATELKKNLGKYLELAKEEDVMVTKNGKVIAKITNPNAGRVELVKSLAGIARGAMSLEEARNERLAGK